ncbi:hypothetical protein Pdca_22090 [Pseudonocardia autotrophica]|nr:hypothetical protein Pdca_22090 [Pseudonocardia autotrophica]
MYLSEHPPPQGSPRTGTHLVRTSAHQGVHRGGHRGSSRARARTRACNWPAGARARIRACACAPGLLWSQRLRCDLAALPYRDRVTGVGRVGVDTLPRPRASDLRTAHRAPRTAHRSTVTPVQSTGRLTTLA